MESLDLGSRLWMAFILPWKVLLDGNYAAKVEQAGDATPALPEPEPEPEVVPEAPERDLSPALQLLSILQREGRFVDFLQEDLAAASDADIGAAARVVHEGCNRGLKDYVGFAAIRSEDEGAKIELSAGYDAARNRVTGNVGGEPPYSGTLAHHGWHVESLKLPELADGHDPRIVTPAEVEL